MVLRKWFSCKKTKSKTKGTEKKDDAATEKSEQPPKHADANVVYPFHDVKATSFPPPLSLDAAVHTDPKTVTIADAEIQKESPSHDKDEKAEKEEIKDEDKVCDPTSCKKEKCSQETCVQSRKKTCPEDTEEKISPAELTEVINSSIKEAVQTIVKQCRMQDEKLGPDETVCYTNKVRIPVKMKREHRSHPAQEQFGDRSRVSKLKESREKYKNVRSPPKKLHEEGARSRGKRGEGILEGVRSKKRSKSANNVKTDNRRMTGNVNIYICSEANENAQATVKQKNPEPCTESSSDTATEQTKISSSKLVTCIRNKRRKSKEQGSFCLPSKKEESSDNSTVYSCTSKYTDSNSTTGLESSNFIEVCNNIDKDVCVKSTESTLSNCECNDTNISSSLMAIDNSDVTFQKSKFVICDKIEKPCSTIYPVKCSSNSESEGWSTKSACSSRNIDRIPLEPNIGYRIDYNENRRGLENAFKNACKCCKRNRDFIGKNNMRCNYNNKRRPSKAIGQEPLLICNCIVEEEEEDVCVNVKAEELKESNEQEKTDVTVCRKMSENLNEPVSFAEHPDNLKKSTDISKERIPKDAEGEQETKAENTNEKEAPRVNEDKQGKDLRRTSMSVTSPKLIRREAMVLRNILKQPKTVESVVKKKVPAVPARNVDFPKQPANNNTNSKPVTLTPPDILKRFNLPRQYASLKQPAVEGKEASSREKSEKTSKKKTVEEKLKKKTSEDKDNAKERDKRGSFLLKRLKKIVAKTEHSETKPEQSVKEGKVAEPTLPTINTDKNVEMPKTEANKSETPIKPVNETKETQKEKDKIISSKLFSYLKLKNNKPEQSTLTSVNPPTKKENKTVNEDNLTADPSEPVREGTKKETRKASDVGEGKQNKSKLITAIGNKHPPIPALQTPRADKKLTEQESHGPLKETQLEEKKTEAEPREPAMQEEKPTKKIHVDTHVEKEAVTPCTQPHRLESHTISTDSTCVKHGNLNECFTTETSPRNCCYSPIPQCFNEPLSYPKSCSKKQGQCCHIDHQENNFSIPCRDKRNWEECGCRRTITCNGCCKPRNECSCRRTVTCANCYKPKSNCVCKTMYETTKACRCMKSMFCLYCDNPREKCVCRAPIRKCSCCELSLDLCMCNDRKTICDGRPVLTEPDNDRTMYVTAWKPREEVRRYFSRNLADLRTDSVNECCCYEKLKSHNSDDLPYQRLSVFSDVMDELQQKLSESTCCTRCKKIPCCCNITTDEGREERKIKYRISPKTHRKIIAVCMKKSRNKLSNNCKCESGQAKGDKQKRIIVTLCCACQATPCRCKKSKSSQKRPRAKCYYCKSSPCVCIAARERNKSRLCRCTDSPRRAKEKESVPCGKTSTKPKNNDEKTICVY